MLDTYVLSFVLLSIIEVLGPHKLRLVYKMLKEVNMVDLFTLKSKRLHQLTLAALSIRTVKLILGLYHPLLLFLCNVYFNY